MNFMKKIKLSWKISILSFLFSFKSLEPGSYYLLLNPIMSRQVTEIKFLASDRAANVKEEHGKSPWKE